MQNFAEQLGAVRKERHITQEQLAQEMNVSRTTISRWEKGIMMPDIDTIKHLSQVLNYNFFTVEGLAEEAQTAPEAEEIPAQPEENTAQETAVQQTETAPRKKRFVLPVVLGAVLLCAVLIVCLLMNDKPADEPANLYEPYSREWYQQEQTPVEGQAFLLIGATENPVMAVRQDFFPDGIGWLYSIHFQETNGITFTMEEMTITTFHTSGATRQEVLNADQLTEAFGSCVFADGALYSWGGGMPVQDISSLGILAKGTDANGNALEFHGYVELSQEVKEN